MRIENAFFPNPQSEIRNRQCEGGRVLPDLLSMPGKAPPMSRTIHWRTCAFSVRLMLAKSFSASLILPIVDHLPSPGFGNVTIRRLLSRNKKHIP
jgi:hypothetical protein